MRIAKYLLSAVMILFSSDFYAQSGTIKFNNQDLFLNGSNIAWVSFAYDIGPGTTDFKSFEDMLLSIHDHGGNSARWWLHTDGTNTPAFDNSGKITGPGQGTISDIKKVLDIAWEREIGVDLCLWSFSMLNKSQSDQVLTRNFQLLTDTTFTRAYINNCLIPMVDSLKGHPGILSWEIFNEPEGMSDELGWSTTQHVPMAMIQRFINMCAGAIHRTDPNALVTNGANNFQGLTDIPASVVGKINYAQLDEAELNKIADDYSRKLKAKITTGDVIEHFQKIAGVQNINYYTDDRLINAGGDPQGTLDYYSVHFYQFGNNVNLSPFNHPASYWQLDKPVVVAEFHVISTFGVSKNLLYTNLYDNGYAGALAWSWTDNAVTEKSDILNGLQSVWDAHKSAVDVNGISGDWPLVSIINPTKDTTYAENSDVKITADASDPDGTIVKVEFFANDTLKIGETNKIPYTVIWTNSPAGIYSIIAVATDNTGNQRKSERINITVGSPQFTRLEESQAVRSGPTSNMVIKSDPTASMGKYIDITTNDTTATVTWALNNVPSAGSYEIKFGYRMAHGTPKTQFINVNGSRTGELEFSSASTTIWYEKGMNVNLVQGMNTIQMQMSWGWMHLDYLAVPADIATDVENEIEIPNAFILSQNYPNPFNPSTIISFYIPMFDAPSPSAAEAGAVEAHVTLKIYDILGREIKTLVNEQKAPGTYKVDFDGTGLASGIYFYTLRAGDNMQSKKMILIK